ncbi:uncharacterized protein LOC127010056 [Eriocheir sinensis]|uniref:uncharacterized protein LOC127010056 n=1 Tax=Eriocheir sinensis TaxID=95602 RepID=UPI0021C7FAB8|nr:uncharacterized protein LOC127010056 [Eriocheir sinensis]XP_050739756.1 uncharacterized protein LOC127010056 [Eriocheir sinensis]XP_050739757.1 uncharacterized protein LOC127010056 [Eriocheir sinensis]
MKEDVEAFRRKVQAEGATFTYLHVDSRTLARYLRAHGSVEDAYKKLMATEQWRKETKVSNLTASTPGVRRMSTTNLAEILDARDKKGRPVAIVAVRNHSLLGRDMDDMIQYMLYTLEKIQAQCGTEKEPDVPDNICLLFDMRGFRLTCMDYPALSKLFYFMQDHYPERLGVCLVLNAPLIFSTCWPIIRAWLDENTASKIKFVKMENIDEFLDSSLVPVHT